MKLLNKMNKKEVQVNQEDAEAGWKNLHRKRHKHCEHGFHCEDNICFTCSRHEPEIKTYTNEITTDH